jgi:hypothetical protein
LTRCAHCLGEHRSQPDQQDCDEGPLDCQNCQSVLAERDCDNACAEIDYALRTRTTKAMREAMCGIVDKTCGVEERESCAAALPHLYFDLSGLQNQAGEATVGRPEPLALEESLALDATVEGCWRCTDGVRKALSKQQDQPMHERCSVLVAACSESCGLVRPVSLVLGPASRALALCDLSARCVASPPALGLGGEGASEAGLASVRGCRQEPPPSQAGSSGILSDAERAQRFADCFERRVPCTEPEFQTSAAACLDCSNARDCNEVATNCKTLCEGEAL